ncbi:MAG: glycosyltransferase family 2 protein [Pseudomonadota bacterium]
MAQTTTLIATARNEGPFLLEWVAYHRAIGFDQIIILSDPSHDGTEALLDKLASTRAITHIPRAAQAEIDTKGFRNRAYAHALTLDAVQSSDWVMVLDIDEYLNIHVGSGTLTDLFNAMEKHGHTDVISLSWRIFGNAGQTEFINRLLLPRFVRAAPGDHVVDEKHLGVKSFFRPGPVVRIGPHRPRLGPDHRNGHASTIWRNGSGRDVTEVLLENGWALTEATRGTTLAQVNHYPVRSNAVFALHHLQKPALTGEQRALTLAEHEIYNTNHVADSSITRWAQSTTAEIKRLQSFSGVQSAHKDCVLAFQSLIAQMKSQEARDPNSAVLRLLDPDIAKAAVKRQSTNTATAPKAPENAAAMQMVDPQDIAPAWLSDLRRSANKRGWYYSDDTFAMQMTMRSNDVLVVSFDNLSDVSETSLARTTWGYTFYRDEGWSHMGVMAYEKNWFRDPRLFNFLEGQVKTGIFKRYRQVVFTGTSMGAYAATAFASLSPGCTVLAFSPQSTLAEDLVPWEDRFGSGRRLDWTGRYRDATEHCTKAKKAFIVFDPYFAPDKMHAERYQGDNIVPLKSWYATHKSARFMRRADILKDVMRSAVADTLTPASYYKLYRARRSLPWYVAGLTDHLFDKGHTKLAAGLANHLHDINRHGLAQDIENRL